MPLTNVQSEDPGSRGYFVIDYDIAHYAQIQIEVLIWASRFGPCVENGILGHYHKHMPLQPRSSSKSFCPSIIQHRDFGRHSL